MKRVKGSFWKACWARAARKAFTAGVLGKTLMGEGREKAAALRRTREGVSSGVQGRSVRGMVEVGEREMGVGGLGVVVLVGEEWFAR